ncbi:leucine-rich repeat-containing G-protein coupled receptor 5-like [Ruditapes philippinarum]|uniref:leucine-rich repeat-containing G-protein coupled receptor 5-like n=1 Tax=Ruditapes philippinarum TaxID=129788 RepID=UPI00295AA4F6|nr:leucine-rich repeat-containing G-protein coupled receptor 5-like [Ruditapes philippinarum]
MTVGAIKMRITIIISIILLAAFLESPSAFLLVDNCPVSSPCTCSGSSGSSYIRCDSKSLSSIPTFKQSSYHVNKLYLYFYTNKLSIIFNNAFRNFSSINASEIDLRLDGNKIKTIETNAFSGIENTTTSLHLQSNNLTTLPLAIGNLFKLRSLNILDNPLHSLDESVMSNIGRSLTSLSIDLNHFTEWPHELHFLRVLHSLSVTHIPFSHLDIHAFHGFEQTLNYLYVIESKLEKVPFAICYLSHLLSFEFSYNSNLEQNKSSILEPCSKKLTSVLILKLDSNNLHIFPDIFSLFPSLTSVSLYNNKLQYIENTKVPSNSKLTSFSLQLNHFERIPYALNKLKSLSTINILENHITTIETPDIAGLTSLTSLTIGYNPITYISPNAFNLNSYLRKISLEHTNLDHVPVAVTNLTSMRHFYLSGMPIDCTCDDMSYLKQWNVSNIVTFRANCSSSSETIKTYILNALQACP